MKRYPDFYNPWKGVQISTSLRVPTFIYMTFGSCYYWPIHKSNTTQQSYSKLHYELLWPKSYINKGSQFFQPKNSRLSPGFVQVKKPFSGLYCKQFWHQKEDAKGVLNSQEYKTWKKLSQHNIEMLYILTFQVLSRFSAKFLVMSKFSDFLE